MKSTIVTLLIALVVLGLAGYLFESDAKVIAMVVVAVIAIPSLGYAICKDGKSGRMGTSGWSDF
jgi:hypothetical protein